MVSNSFIIKFGYFILILFYSHIGFSQKTTKPITSLYFAPISGLLYKNQHVKIGLEQYLFKKISVYGEYISYFDTRKDFEKMKGFGFDVGTKYHFPYQAWLCLSYKQTRQDFTTMIYENSNSLVGIHSPLCKLSLSIRVGIGSRWTYNRIYLEFGVLLGVKRSDTDILGFSEETEKNYHLGGNEYTQLYFRFPDRIRPDFQLNGRIGIDLIRKK